MKKILILLFILSFNNHVFAAGMAAVVAVAVAVVETFFINLAI